MGFPTKFEFLCKQQIIFFAYVCPKCCRGHTLKIIPCLSEIQIELGVLYFIWHFYLEVEERDKKKKANKGIHLCLPEEGPSECSWPQKLPTASLYFNCDPHTGRKVAQSREQHGMDKVQRGISTTQCLHLLRQPQVTTAPRAAPNGASLGRS